jgi:chromosome segregation ATPase
MQVDSDLLELAGMPVERFPKMRIRLGVIIAGGFLMGGASVGVCAWRLPIDARPLIQDQTQTQTQGAQQDSVADAARKAREKAKANATPAKKTYTNDNVSALRVNEISVLAPNANQLKDTAPDTAAAKPAEPKKDEAYWRKKFAEARTKLEFAQKDLDISQRELNLLQTQFYADPNKALQQQFSRDDINAKTAKVDEKKQQVADLTQAIEDMKDDLRHSGGEPGWGN